jgi:hypothetical protein
MGGTDNASEIVDFGEWMPDLGNFNNPGATEAKNCISLQNRYRPFASFSEFTNALAAICKGAFAYRDAAGNVTIFAATRTKIYKLNNLSWVEVTRGASTTPTNYATAADGFWDFLSFGNLVIATNYTDDIQVYNISSATEFSQLSATAPRCRRFFILANFLVTLDVVDGDGATGYRVRWSPLANPAGTWGSFPTTTQADFQDIYGGDFANVAGVAISNNVGIIIQEKAIWRMEYVGGAQIFNIQKIEDARGSIANRSVIGNGRSVFYLGEDGFYEFDGGSSIPIGQNKVDKWFFENFDETYDYNITSAVDSINKIVLWAFPSIEATGGVCDKIIVFNWIDRRWTLINATTELLFQYLSLGYTLDGLDTLYSSIEDIPFSLDSRVWTGGKTIFGAFDGSHKLGSFNGSPLTATITTPEIRPNPNGRSVIKSVISYIEGGSSSCRLAYRNDLASSITYTAATSKNPYTGEYDFDVNATFFRAEFTISGSWDVAIRMSIRAGEAGYA